MAGNNDRYMLVSIQEGVVVSQIKNLKTGVEELRRLGWFYPDLVLVKVVTNAKEVL